MALKRNIQEEHYCKNCAHAYDYHEKGKNGEPFLCRCPFEKWSQFLNYPNRCVNFKTKEK